MSREHPRRRSLVVGALASVLVLTGCTGGDAERPPPESPGAEASERPSEEAEAGALHVELASVAGKLPRRQREQIRKRVAVTVGDYLREAFLGDYPRTSYRAFDNFTDAARSRARPDRGLLTHADRGARYAGVTPRHQHVRVHAFAPRRRVLGATARVRLVLLVERDDDTVQRVRVTGRLLLTRARNGAFRIFGYDLRRTSARPRTGGGA